MNRDEQNKTADDFIDEFLPQILKQGFITLCYKTERLLFLNFEYYKEEKILKAQSQKGYRHLLMLLCADIFENNAIRDEADKLFPYSFSVNIPDEERFFDMKMVTIELKDDLISIEYVFIGIANDLIGEYIETFFAKNFSETFTKAQKSSQKT